MWEVLWLHASSLGYQFPLISTVFCVLIINDEVGVFLITLILGVNEGGESSSAVSTYKAPPGACVCVLAAVYTFYTLN